MRVAGGSPACKLLATCPSELEHALALNRLQSQPPRALTGIAAHLCHASSNKLARTMTAAVVRADAKARKRVPLQRRPQLAPVNAGWCQDHAGGLFWPYNAQSRAYNRKQSVHSSTLGSIDVMTGQIVMLGYMSRSADGISIACSVEAELSLLALRY